MLRAAPARNYLAFHPKEVPRIPLCPVNQISPKLPPLVSRCDALFRPSPLPCAGLNKI